MVRFVSEDADSLLISINLDRVYSEITPVFLRSRREPFVEVGVLFESQKFLFVVEKPEEVLRIQKWTELHCHTRESIPQAISMSWLTFHNGVTVVNKGPVDKELNYRLLPHWYRQPKIKMWQSKGHWKPLRPFPSRQNRHGALILRLRC